MVVDPLLARRPNDTSTLNSLCTSLGSGLHTDTQDQPAHSIDLAAALLGTPEGHCSSRTIATTSLQPLMQVSVHPRSVAGSDAKTPVDFFFDILSPYSYFAFETLLRLRDEWNLDIRLKPIFQSAVMQKTGNSPPALVPKKGAYMAKDVYRLGQYFGIKVKIPKAMQQVMMGSLPVQRIIVAVQLKHSQDVLEKVIHNFWVRHWSNDQDILSKDSQVTAITVGTGISKEQAEELIAWSTSQEVKSKLSQFTEEALEAGVFGIPSFVVPDAKGKKQLLFGSDRFHILAMIIGKEWTGPHAKIASKL